MAKEQSNLQLASDLATVITRLHKKLRSQSTTSGILSLTERSVMGLLYRQKQMMPTELAAAEKITTQSMSQVLNHLLELELIRRKPSTKDKRKVNIVLSAGGQKLVNKVRNERDEWLNNALTETCSAAELNALHKAIAPLTRLVDFE